MNRRSFIAGILAACVAPAILVPKEPDHNRWRVRRRHGLWIAEYRYIVMLPPSDFVFKDLILEEAQTKFVERERFEYVNRVPVTDQEKPIIEANAPRGSWTFVEWHGPPSEVLADCST